jgi:hypothetical protein
MGSDRRLRSGAGGYSGARGSSRSPDSERRDARLNPYPGRVFVASSTSVSSETFSTKICVSSSTLSRTIVSPAREMVAARCVTSSIAARTVDAPSTVSIREIAVVGASSPTRHCTRIARIAGGCRPSVRRVMASASMPVRLLMSVRFEMGDHSSIDVASLAQDAPAGPKPDMTRQKRGRQCLHENP